jgi:hypothetical protein
MKKVASISIHSNRSKNKNRSRAFNIPPSLNSNLRLIDLLGLGLIGKIKQEFDGIENSLKPKNTE